MATPTKPSPAAATSNRSKAYAPLASTGTRTRHNYCTAGLFA